jgi:iron complex transport system permease protein
MRAKAAWIALALAPVVLAVLHAAWGGSAGLGLDEILRELQRGDGAAGASNIIVWRLRLPRMAGAALCGAGLGLVGSAFQSLFRNPLAEPYVVGVSSGAALGGALAILLGWTAAGATWILPAAGAVGGLAALLLVLSLAGFRGGVKIESLLLSGVAVGAALSAWVSVALLMAGQDSNIVLRWLLGSVTPMFWDRVAILAVLIPPAAAAMLLQARSLNAMAAGEFMAERVGVRTGRVKWTVLGSGAVLAGAIVGTVGIIPFLGLAAPQIARSLVGGDARRALPASMLAGSALLLAADLAAQRIQPGLELPVGSVTALIGAPFLIRLLQRRDSPE